MTKRDEHGHFKRDTNDDLPVIPFIPPMQAEPATQWKYHGGVPTGGNYAHRWTTLDPSGSPLVFQVVVGKPNLTASEALEEHKKHFAS